MRRKKFKLKGKKDRVDGERCWRLRGLGDQTSVVVVVVVVVGEGRRSADGIWCDNVCVMAWM